SLETTAGSFADSDNRANSSLGVRVGAPIRDLQIYGSASRESFKEPGINAFGGGSRALDLRWFPAIGTSLAFHIGQRDIQGPKPRSLPAYGGQLSMTLVPEVRFTVEGQHASVESALALSKGVASDAQGATLEWEPWINTGL